MPLLADELRVLEAELHHPGVNCSRERLEQLLHPGFHEIGRSGQAYSRDTVLNYLASQPGPTALEAGDYAAHWLSENCALLTYRSVHQSTEGPSTQAALRSSIWLKTGQGWQLFFHQGTPAPR
jgi:hypothetical protein